MYVLLCHVNALCLVNVYCHHAICLAMQKLMEISISASPSASTFSDRHIQRFLLKPIDFNFIFPFVEHFPCSTNDFSLLRAVHLFSIEQNTSTTPQNRHSFFVFLWVQFMVFLCSWSCGGKSDCCPFISN